MALGGQYKSIVEKKQYCICLKPGGTEASQRGRLRGDADWKISVFIFAAEPQGFDE